MVDTSAKAGASAEQLRLQAIEVVGNAIAETCVCGNMNGCAPRACDCRIVAKAAIEAYEKWRAI